RDARGSLAVDRSGRARTGGRALSVGRLSGARDGHFVNAVLDTDFCDLPRLLALHGRAAARAIAAFSEKPGDHGWIADARRPRPRADLTGPSVSRRTRLPEMAASEKLSHLPAVVSRSHGPAANQAVLSHRPV